MRGMCELSDNSFCCSISLSRRRCRWLTNLSDKNGRGQLAIERLLTPGSSISDDDFGALPHFLPKAFGRTVAFSLKQCVGKKWV